jgi:hypothetical protein
MENDPLKMIRAEVLAACSNDETLEVAECVLRRVRDAWGPVKWLTKLNELGAEMERSHGMKFSMRQEHGRMTAFFAPKGEGSEKS